MGRLVMLLRYPLKSARGERLHSVDVEPAGLHGDRAWACIDAADGTVGSAKHPQRWGRLLDVSATVRTPGEGDAAPNVWIEVGGAALPAGSWRADAALSDHLGRRVHLTREVPENARLHRRLPDEPDMVPEWMAAAPGEELVTRIAGANPGGRFVDFGAVHLVTTGALADLADRLGRPSVPPTRFRPNLVIDAAADPEPGTQLRIGDVVLRVLMPTPRCAVPGLDHGEAPTDRPLLTTLARHYRTQVPGRGRAACFGVYAEILQPGQVDVGQRVG